MNEWSFPSNGNGQIKGFADPGIETFSGNELQSLARETCQNSLDACADEQMAVRVEYVRYFIKSTDIPGYESFKEIIEKCKNYWDLQNTEKAHKFLKTACQMIRQDKVFVLRISDYNTKGLSDPYGNSFEGWNSLTKVDGGSTKNGDSAGSFGVGKNAPFSNSYYRLVFYRTLNEDNQVAAQGMSRLLSFPTDISNPMDTMTIGIGYYGNKIKNMPVARINELESLDKRSEIGTDVFIYGFKKQNWKDEMVAEILESFLVAIHSNKLEVKVDDVFINSKNLGGLFKKYANTAKDAYCNYRVLSEADKISTSEMEFHKMGILKLKVLIDPNEKLNKRILVVRKSGMRLFQMTNISKTISFTGILELEGVKLNEYFREMETMAHDKWEPKRHSNPKQAKEYYDELKDWVRKTVMDLGEYSSDEEVEVEGLSGVLQDNESVRADDKSQDKKENLNNNLGSIDIIERSRNSSDKGVFYVPGDDDSRDLDDEDEPGDIDPRGKSSTTRTLKGKRKRKTKKKHLGNPTESGEEIIHNKSGVNNLCNLKYVRVIKLGNSRFIATFEIPHYVNSGHIDIVTVGENGRSSKLFIESAVAKAACSNITVNDGVIEFSGMECNEKVKIEFSLNNPYEYAMEVDVYEHNQ